MSSQVQNQTDAERQLDKASPQQRLTAQATSSRALSDVLAHGGAWLDQHWLLTLAVVVTIALWLRLVLLAQSSLWVDEMWSIGISRMPWHVFPWIMRHQDPNMPLYYAVLHFWMGLGGSEVVVRSLSVLFAVATIPALYALGTYLYDKRVALIASSLMVVHAFHVQWSQEARSYSLLVLLLTLSCLFFAMSIRNPRPLNFVLYVLASVLAFHAHIFAALVLVAQAASLLFLKRREVPWKGLLSSAGAIAFLTAPLGLLIVERARNPWLPLGWLPKTSLHVVYDQFYAVAGNADFPGSSGGKLILGAYALVCLLAFFAWVGTWRSEGNSFQSWRTAFLICWLGVPIAMLVAASLAQPILMNRYLLICIPALVLLAAQWLRSIRPAALSLLAVVILLAVAAARLPQYYRHRAEFQPWKSATDYVLGKQLPGDAAIFCVAPGRLLFDYYRERYHGASSATPAVIYPEWSDSRNDPKVLDYLPPLTGSLSQAALRNHERVWLVVYHDTFPATRQARDQIEKFLATKYGNVDMAKFYGVTVLLYSNGSLGHVSRY